MARVNTSMEYAFFELLGSPTLVFRSFLANSVLRCVKFGRSLVYSILWNNVLRMRHLAIRHRQNMSVAKATAGVAPTCHRHMGTKWETHPRLKFLNSINPIWRKPRPPNAPPSHST